MRSARVLSALLVVAYLSPAGCIPVGVVNPAITVTPLSASADLTRMENSPRPLARPVVILNGYRTLPLHISALRANLVRATSGKCGDFLAISYPLDTDFDTLARDVTDEINERWPSHEPGRTVDVDVVGVSMGGLVARWAALPPERRNRFDDEKDTSDTLPAPCRLSVVRLFTLATPHQGAHLADYFHLDDAAADMRPGSRFLAALDQGLDAADYEMVCYAQQRDLTVGATRAAPPGREPIWTGGTILFSHMTIVENTIFVADIARRLRGEEPLVQPAGPPEKD